MSVVFLRLFIVDFGLFFYFFYQPLAALAPRGLAG
jgi:hypothetical protein